MSQNDGLHTITHVHIARSQHQFVVLPAYSSCRCRSYEYFILTARFLDASALIYGFKFHYLILRTLTGMASHENG